MVELDARPCGRALGGGTNRGQQHLAAGRGEGLTAYQQHDPQVPLGGSAEDGPRDLEVVTRERAEGGSCGDRVRRAAR